MFDMFSYFQDYGHDVNAATRAAASAGCPLARRARATLLAHMCFLSTVPDS